MEDRLLAEKTRKILQKVRALEIQTKRALSDSLLGSYHSLFKGQGIDLKDIRHYIPGDDVRAIDWKTTAKTNETFLKEYEEERELTVVLAVDLSGSTEFGSIESSKRDYAAEMAALLAFSAMLNGDKVGLMLYTDQVELFLPPNKGKGHLLRSLRELLFFKPKSRKTHTGQALQAMNHLLKHRSIVFLFSDFLEPELLDSPKEDSVTKRMLKLTQTRHDLVAITLMDPYESVFPKMGNWVLEDLEEKGAYPINTHSEQFQRSYQAWNTDRVEALDTFFRKNNIDWLNLQLGADYAKALRRFFINRKGARF